MEGDTVVSPLQQSQHINKSRNNLKAIALALANSLNAVGPFPTQRMVGNQQQGRMRPATPQETTGLSWRVALLPYLDEKQLYEEFHLDEPWDSPHNKKLIDRMPMVFHAPGAKNKRGITNYLAVVGKQSVIQDGPTPVKLGDIIDGTSRTIVVVEVDNDQAVPWTKPSDYDMDSGQFGAGLGELRSGSFLAALADGSVHSIPREVDSSTLKALFTRNGREPVDPRALHQNSLTQPSGTSPAAPERDNIRNGGQTIPKGAVKFKDRYYKFIYQPRISWTDAQKACSSMKGQLAIVSNQEIKDFLQQHKGTARVAWIGAKVNAEGKLAWLNGEPVELEHNGYGNGRHYLSMGMKGSLNPRWGKGKGPYVVNYCHGYLCEWTADLVENSGVHLADTDTNRKTHIPTSETNTSRTNFPKESTSQVATPQNQQALSWLKSRAALVSTSPTTGIVTINLVRSTLSDDELANLAKIEKLSVLNLFANARISDDGLSQLSELKDLEALGLMGQRFSNEGIAKLKSVPQLKTLILIDEPFDDSCVEHLKQLSNLTSLNLMHTKVSDDGLAGIKNMKNLTSLNLMAYWPMCRSTFQSQITDAGVIHLAQMDNLQDLILDKNRITDAGVAKLSGMTNLTNLGLGKTSVTDAGLVHLSALTKLETLNLRGTRVTDAGVEKLQQALPNCKIQH